MRPRPPPNPEPDALPGLSAAQGAAVAPPGPSNALHTPLAWILLALWSAWIAFLACMGLPYWGVPRAAPDVEKGSPEMERWRP